MSSRGPQSWKATDDERGAVYRRISAKRRARIDAIAHKMAEAYERLGQSLSAVAREFHTDKGTVKYALQRNGHPVRVVKSVQRQANGSPVRYSPKTKAEIAALVSRATRLVVPPELKFEWRRWSLAQRGRFIAALRAKLQLPNERPVTPFSANVEPFDYASAKAHDIARILNVGRDSRTARVLIHICSQGVIYQGRLYFWSKHCGPAYFIGPWRPGTGRPPLHHVIYEQEHGPVPAGHCVRHADGNRNNFAPSNLVLATKNDVCRENQAVALLKKSRRITTLLLDRSQKKHAPHETRLISSLSAGQRSL